MDDLLKKIKQSWNENPLQTAAVGALVVSAAAKFMDAWSKVRGRRTWDKEVSRRDRESRRRR